MTLSIFRFIISSIIFLISIALFCLLNNLLYGYTRFNSLIAFSSTLLLVILFHEKFRSGLRKIIARNYFIRINKTVSTLDTLNKELNKAIRYQDVTRILFRAFRILFPDTPYAFYISENGNFNLETHNNIRDDEVLALNLNQSDFEDLNTVDEIISLKESKLTKTNLKKLQDAGLTSILPFPGKMQVFALLLIDEKNITFKRNKEAMKLFRKVQNKAGVVLENSALFVDLEQRNLQVKRLIEISEKILSSFDVNEILGFILTSLKTVTRYDAAAIFLLDKSGKHLLRNSSEGYSKKVMERLHLKVGQGACGWVVESGQMSLIKDVREAEHYYMLRKATRSQLSIPLIHNKNVLGVLCLESNRIGFFNESLAETLKLFAQLAAIAIFNARHVDTVIAQRALENELINASIVQKKLLVQRFPQSEHFKITAVNRASKIVSGDLYDVIRYNERTYAIAIGDVSGKGAGASLMMALLLAGLRSQKKSFFTACDMVYRLNNLLTEATIEGLYATFFFAIFSLNRNKLIFTNAGHNPPLLAKADGTIVRLETGGIVLGYLAEWEYEQSELDWEPGDVLLAYTDGITETLNDSGEEFGEERLIQLLQSNRQRSVYDIRNTIFHAIKEFSGTDAQDDDQTLVICKNE